MKLSRREIVMLVLLLLIALTFIEYRFIFVPMLEKYDVLNNRKMQLEAEIDEINLKLNLANTIKEKLDENLVSIETVSKPFLDGIHTDVLLLYAHELVQRHGFIPGNYSFSGLEVADLTPEEASIEMISYEIKNIADRYNELRNVESENVTPEQDQQNEEQILMDQLERYRFSVQAQASYDQIKSLMDEIHASNRTVLVSSLNIQSATELTNTSFTITFYGIRKLAEENDEFTEWSRAPIDSGIDNPFLIIEIDENEEPTEPNVEDEEENIEEDN